MYGVHVFSSYLFSSCMIMKVILYFRAELACEPCRHGESVGASHLVMNMLTALVVAQLNSELVLSVIGLRAI
jgi:hypothetical protein